MLSEYVYQMVSITKVGRVWKRGGASLLWEERFKKCDSGRIKS